MKVRPILYFFFVATFFSNIVCVAQEEQPKKKKDLKNTINYTISNPLIFGFSTVVIGYERVVGEHQSACIELGHITLPSFSILSNSIKANKQSEEKGMKIVLEYRFYPKAENKFNAPRGVYFAPYFSYNYFNRKNSFVIDTSSTNFPADVSVSTDFTLKIGTIGAELGYQFIFWRRFTLDLVLIGPGISKYTINANLDTTLEPNDESELFEAINDALAEKIPGYSRVIKPGEFNKTGSTNTTSIGFRYLVKVGFRF